MLMIFNLNWPRISISEQVIAANSGMRRLAEAVGLSNNVIYDCASMGAGEKVLPFSNPQQTATLDKLNYLRWHHQIARKELDADPIFRLNHETREMIDTLKSWGHSLAAVWAGATEELETSLEGARCRDAFGDAVFGYDRLPQFQARDFTSMHLCREAARYSQAGMDDAIVVADTPKGVQEGAFVRPLAVVGYVSSAESEERRAQQTAELEGAGANYTLIGGNSVATLPVFFTALSAGSEERKSQQAAKSEGAGKSYTLIGCDSVVTLPILLTVPSDHHIHQEKKPRPPFTIINCCPS